MTVVTGIRAARARRPVRAGAQGHLRDRSRGAAVFWLKGVPELVATGLVPGRSKDNAEADKSMVSGVKSDADATLLFDLQTSGGLLVALPEQGVGPFLEAMKASRLGVKAIGRVTPQGEHDVGRPLRRAAPRVEGVAPKSLPARLCAETSLAWTQTIGTRDRPPFTGPGSRWSQ